MKRILCVDDDTDFAQMVAEVLKTEGYTVKLDSGKNIHHLLRTEKYGLVLLDEQLKWTWGSDLCLELKRDPKTKDIPVALISAAADIAKVQERCGAEGFVRKPFDIVHLINVVDSLYSHYD